MIVYEGTKNDFLFSVENDSIAVEIEKKIYNKMHRATPRNEYRSWENSMQYMYKVLNDPYIPQNAGVAIEYNIPQTSKRIDFLISGYDSSNNGSVVVIELKQWDQINAIFGQDASVETYVGKGMRTVVHPSYQAWSYCMLIKDYNESVQTNRINLYPCSYLHNYRKKENDPLEEAQYEPYLQEAPAFTRGEVNKLRDFIKKSIRKGDEKKLLYQIDNGKIRPSKSLQDSLSAMLKGNKEFIMIDEQKIIYEEVLRISKKSKTESQKSVVIIKGGPGTGKTVVAINLLVELTQLEQFCQYVSKNSAPRNVYREKLKGEMKRSSVDNMFKGSGTFVDAPHNAIDTVLVDEAHRLNAKSGIFRNLGENQIKEIIEAAKCSVFFVDDNQRVTIDDIGSVEEIKKWAVSGNATIYEYELISQFRCNGSDGYLAWLDQVLEIKETANYDMKDIDYDIRIVDSPKEVQHLIVERNRLRNRARMLAGYCWNWIKEGENNTTIHDIVIGDFGMSWNLKSTSTFAIDETSVNEVGCIHTSQGLEFDYVGVIIGEDLRYEDDHLVTDFTKRATTDKSLKGIKKMHKQNPEKAKEMADEIIKNTYRTLMTRGMKGCYIYCVDEKLAQYLKRRL